MKPVFFFVGAGGNAVFSDMLRQANCNLHFHIVSLVPLLRLTCVCRLRALSGGGGSGGSGGGGSSGTVASPPLSPALPKYKLADYRYGREEMLALYIKDNKVGITSVT